MDDPGDSDVTPDEDFESMSYSEIERRSPRHSDFEIRGQLRLQEVLRQVVDLRSQSDKNFTKLEQRFNSLSNKLDRTNDDIHKMQLVAASAPDAMREITRMLDDDKEQDKAIKALQQTMSDRVLPTIKVLIYIITIVVPMAMTAVGGLIWSVLTDTPQERWSLPRVDQSTPR